MIKEADIFNLKFENPDVCITDQVEGRLFIGDAYTSTMLKGNFIEKQYLVGDNFLIFMSTDIMNECINIYYLDRSYTILDCIEVVSSNPHPAGLCLEKVKILNENQLYFDFLTIKPWVLTFLERPRKHLFSWRPLSTHRLTKSIFSDVYMKITHCKQI